MQVYSCMYNRLIVPHSLDEVDIRDVYGNTIGYALPHLITHAPINSDKMDAHVYTLERLAELQYDTKL